MTGKPLTGSEQVSAMDGLDSLTVVELKNRLRADGQKVSGAKKELILRLRRQKSETFLEFETKKLPQTWSLQYQRKFRSVKIECIS